MIAMAIYQTAGIGIGIFLGAVLGFSIQARKGNRDNLVRDSVVMTAVLAGMLAWVAAALLKVVL